MKEIYKNPLLYYIVVPVLLAFWPLLVWGIYLPKTEGQLQDLCMQFKKGQGQIAKILELDQDRLDYSDSQNQRKEFDYPAAVAQIAGDIGISPNNYRINTGMTRVSQGRKTQTAKVVLEHMPVEKFARFLSTMQLRWSGLQCDKVKLTSQEGEKNKWQVDLDFTYFY